MQIHRNVLRIEHKEILGEQTAVSDESAALTGDIGAAVQEIGQIADLAIGNKPSSRGVGAQRCRSGYRGAVDHSSAWDIPLPGSSMLAKKR